MNTTVIIAFACVLILGYALGTFLQQNRELRERVRSLEQSGPKRLPYKSAEALENAIAALIVAQTEVKFKEDLLDNAAAWVRRARNPDGGDD